MKTSKSKISYFVIIEKTIIPAPTWCILYKKICEKKKTTDPRPNIVTTALHLKKAIFVFFSVQNLQ